MTMKRLLLALCFFIGLQHAALAASCSSYPFTLQNNTTADATQVMSNFNTVRNCVINNAAGSGVNTDITSLTGLSTPLSQAQGGSATYIGGTSGGSANAQTVASPTPIGFALTSGWRVTFIAGFTNTGPTTLNVNSTAVAPVKKLGFSGLEALVYGEIVAGNVVEAIYDGTEYVLLSALVPPFGAAQSITSTTTTDIGIYNTHNVVINGTTAITAFGVTASINQPVYNLKFGGALTLTYNATSLIIPGSSSITTATNDTAVVEFLGSGNWRVNSYTRASGAPIVTNTPLCGAIGFSAATNSDSLYSMTATTATLLSTAGVAQAVSSVSALINTAGTGAGGIDTGSLTTSTWYYTYLINNGTTTAGLLSLSATAPTMPSGYIYKCQLGFVPTDGSSHMLRVDQRGSEVWYRIGTGGTPGFPPVIASGVNGTFSLTSPVLAAVTVLGNGFCAPPLTSTAGIWVNSYSAWKGGAAAAMVAAPITAWGYTNSGPQGSVGVVWPIFQQISTVTQNAYFPVTNTAIGFAADAAGGAIACSGFKTTVNAN